MVLDEIAPAPTAEQYAILEQLSQRPKKTQNAAVIADFNDRPPYSVAELDAELDAELEATPLATKQDSSSSPAPSNPHGVSCPLCRRRRTVSLLQISDGARGSATYKCSYSGCFNYEWSE